jgi:hypothetical protein
MYAPRVFAASQQQHSSAEIIIKLNILTDILKFACNTRAFGGHQCPPV